MRDYLKKETQLLKYNIEGDRVFANVGMPTLTIMLSKGNKAAWDFLDTSSNSIVKKMSLHSTLSSITSIMRGLEIGRRQISTNDEVAIITGRDVARYVYYSNHFISSNTAKKYAKDERFFSGERLLIRETGDRITCLYVQTHILSNRSLYTIIINDKHYSYKYVLGVLNSRISQYFYTVMFKAQTELFPKIRIAQVRQLPIPAATPEKQREVESLVDVIIEAKSENINADTSYVETQIDSIVYRLFDLTDEEIKIVEGD